MKIYTFCNKQNVPISVDQAWEFLTNSDNLSKMTPSEMNFQKISQDNRPLYAGQIIQYSVTPIFGIPAKWVSEITQIKEKQYFVDVQLYGPYAMWHHKHFVKEIPGGVEIEDLIDYKIPLSFIGQILHPFVVKPKLEEIFAFRRAKLIQLFGEFPKTTVNNPTF
ncbi:MAG: SRPBCC family protein [Flavobacterium sp.]|nr:SRPBCC family protein [Flavobacterium sp.]